MPSQKVKGNNKYSQLKPGLTGTVQRARVDVFSMRVSRPLVVLPGVPRTRTPLPGTSLGT